VLRIRAVGGVHDRLGHVNAEGSLRCDGRKRSMFSDTRPTIVVNHAPRFSTSLVSDRLSRSQASWTASSASLSEPSIR
jgi:hypothetical protein